MLNVLLNSKTVRKGSYQLEKIKPDWKIPLVSSTMFETMLNNETRKKYLCYLLSLIMEKDINYLIGHIKLVKVELDKNNYHRSKKTVDLVCEIDNEIYNIELNNFTKKVGLERNTSYLNDLYKSKMYQGSDYDYRKTIQINLCNFTFEDHEEEMEEFYLKNEKGIVLTDKIRIIYIYLPKIREKYYNKNELKELEKLLLVFNEQETKELENIMEGNLMMEEYHKEAKEASKKEEIIGIYDKELYDEMMEYHRIKDAREEGIEQGIKQGIEKGKQEEKIGMAKRLLEEKVDIHIISKATGLSIEELEKY